MDENTRAREAGRRMEIAAAMAPLDKEREAGEIPAGGHPIDVAEALRDLAEVIDQAPHPLNGIRAWLRERAHSHRRRAVSMSRAPAPDEVHGALGAAVEFLADALADGPRPSAHVRLDASQSGHSQKTIKRARAYLGVLCEKRKGDWWMILPTRRRSARIAAEHASTRADECEAILKAIAADL